MKRSEVIELMALAKGLFQNLNTDAMTRQAWEMMLSPVSLAAAEEGLLSLAKLGVERVTPGQIYREARIIEAEQAERERSSRLALPEPARSAEEIEKARVFMAGLIATLARKM